MARLKVSLLVIAFVACFTPAAIAIETLTVMGWNVESGGADPDTVAARIKSIDGVDVWGLSEVRNASWADKFETAAGDDEGTGGNDLNFDQVLGTTGSADRLVIVFNAEKYELVKSFELHRINTFGRVRAPLVAHLKDRTTNREFLFMVNHLYRSRANARHQQAAELNRWASQQTLPIVAVGDYNFDWSVTNGPKKHDKGFDLMTDHGVFTWVRPDKYIKTQDSSYNSVLDFVFVSGKDTWKWKAKSEIIVETGDFPDTNQTPDHRPVQATFTFPGS